MNYKRRLSRINRRSLKARSVYPIADNWQRTLWPWIQTPEIQTTLRRAIRTIRYDYDPAIHIPREAGWADAALWGDRDSHLAYHMVGYCHVIVAPMLHLCQLAEPGEDWLILFGLDHSVVISRSGIVFDINGSHRPAEVVRIRAQVECLGDKLGDERWSDHDRYINRVLSVGHPFGAATAISQ